MIDLTYQAWAIMGLAGFLIGLSKTAVPGLGMIVVPMTVMVLGDMTALGALLPMLIVGDIFALIYYRHHAKRDQLVRLLPWVIVGMGAGYLVLNIMKDGQLRPVIGGMILAFAILQVVQKRAGWTAIPSQWWFAAIIGMMAGVATTVAHLAGPIMSIYFLAMSFPKDEFMGTGAWYYFIINSMKVPLFCHLDMITVETLSLNLCTVPVIVAGALCGKWLLPRIPQRHFDRLILGLAVLAALVLLVRHFAITTGE